MARKWHRREQHKETGLSVRDALHGSVNYHIGPAHERLLNEADFRIIEDPHTQVLVWCDELRAPDRRYPAARSIPPSALPSPAHRGPRCPDIAQCSRASCVQAATA